MQWRKSSYSDAEVNCVEVASSRNLVRDSKNPENHLTLTPAGYRSFLVFTTSRPAGRASH
jgi:hypothetical protein